MKHVAPEAGPEQAALRGKARGIARAGRMQQLVMLQEPDQHRDVLSVRLKRRLRAHARHQRVGIARIPARKELELEPSDAKEAIARRVVNHP